MRDILYKNLTSIDHHRRDVFLSEAFEQDGVTTRTEKHFIYNIRDHALLNKPENLGLWVKKHVEHVPRLKDLSVLKSYDSKSGEERFEVRIIGELYILREQDIFSIDFLQIFKINRKGEALKK